MSEPEKIKLESMDIAREKREQLKNLFPEIFDEDSVDYERLKTIIGGGGYRGITNPPKNVSV